MRERPQKSVSRELVETGAEAGINMLPVVGSAMAVAFAYAVNYSFNKRLNLWFDDLAAAVDDLQQRMDEPIAFDDLAEDETFVDAVINATRAAQATHAREKLEALRNGVLNSTLPGAPDDDEQARFFRLVDQFTPAQLRMLSYFDGPREWFASHGIQPQEYMTGSRINGLQQALPEFRNDDWARLVAKDLADNSLLIAGISGMVTGAAVYDRLTTPLAQRFLAFIADPAGATQSRATERNLLVVRHG